jgi:phage FluMu protein Com
MPEEKPRQELRHAQCHHLLALVVNDSAIELECKDCKGKVVIDVPLMQAMISAAKAKRKVEITI